LSLCALWYVRFYLLFVTTAPLVVGLLRGRSKSIARPIFGSLALVAAGLMVLGLTHAAQDVSETASTTFMRGTDATFRSANAEGGSGVMFDDGGSPYGQLWLKLIYTVLAPFPWASGSIAFHVGKVDVLIIAFFMYRSWKVVRTSELRLVALMVATFVVPCTVMYATSMANVGLIARQRLVIVVALAFVAALYQPEKQAESAKASAMTGPLGGRDMESSLAKSRA
jgi:hypothetical protein